MAFSSNPEESECDVAAVRAQVRRISESAAFKHSERRQNFLRYIVEEALAGRADRLKDMSSRPRFSDVPHPSIPKSIQLFASKRDGCATNCTSTTQPKVARIPS